LTPEEFAAMRAAQRDACALCLKPFGSTYGSRMHVDHCHVTGHARAILCHNCNVGLGHFHDDVDLILKAASYVTEHRKRVEGLPSPRRMLTKFERQENRRKAALRQHRSEEGQAVLAARSATFSGENGHAARLRTEDVVEIRRLYATGEVTQRQLGERFGVTQSHIGYIVKRKAWAHVP
jgi:predicted XRE-type DNA-binding protein